VFKEGGTEGQRERKREGGMRGGKKWNGQGKEKKQHSARTRQSMRVEGFASVHVYVCIK
jgi:hypothetical protein